MPTIRERIRQFRETLATFHAADSHRNAALAHHQSATYALAEILRHGPIVDNDTVYDLDPLNGQIRHRTFEYAADLDRERLSPGVIGPPPVITPDREPERAAPIVSAVRIVGRDDDHACIGEPPDFGGSARDEAEAN